MVVGDVRKRVTWKVARGSGAYVQSRGSREAKKSRQTFSKTTLAGGTRHAVRGCRQMSGRFQQLQPPSSFVRCPSLLPVQVLVHSSSRHRFKTRSKIIISCSFGPEELHPSSQRWITYLGYRRNRRRKSGVNLSKAEFLLGLRIPLTDVRGS